MGEPALPIFRDVDAFLAWEERQEERYELVGGVLTLMAGGTENHDLISANAIGTLHNLLRSLCGRGAGTRHVLVAPWR